MAVQKPSSPYNKNECDVIQVHRDVYMNGEGVQA